jgi:Family of unknown function (DUF6093)
VTIPTVLAAGRVAHLQLMLDTCTVHRRSPEALLDPDTGDYTDAPPSRIYDGPCRVRRAGRTEEADQKMRDLVAARYDVALPHDADTPIQIEDTLTVTSSADGWMVGRALVVSGVGLGTTTSARWLTVDDRYGYDLR